DPAFTDDASVAEKQGVPILLIHGEESNFKITTPFDWIVAESYCQLIVKTTN
ncbi:MAG TPA: 2-C-methyl-D-erythritol 4-phosphate cytidylyltransferase, partial [Porphyromonadaceae bacterium]|nr:2-C-methyl-D-erythritol 4-phosphate cytidylyltransferase [Porphyromonadaceae bacterium]